MTTTPQNDGGSNLDWVTPVLLTILIFLFIGTFGWVAAAEYTDGVQEYAENASAYCEQELGEDAYLVNSRVIGEHGGLHCEGPGGEFIHLHDVSREEIDEAAAEAESG